MTNRRPRPSPVWRPGADVSSPRGRGRALAAAACLGCLPALAAGEPLRFESRFTPYATVVSPQGVALGDVDGDGHADVVFTSGTSADGRTPDGRLHLWLGDGSGALRPGASFELGSMPDGVALADLDGDGTLDAVATNSSSRTASILPGVGDGSFGVRRDLPAGVRPARFLARDLDGDARLDLAIVDMGTGQQPPGTLEAVARGDSAWTDSSGVHVYLTRSVNPPAKRAPASAPQRKRAAPPATGALPLPESAAAAGFAARFALGGAVSCVDVDAGDLDGDGGLDLVVACRAPGTLGVWHAAASGGYVRSRDLSSGLEFIIDVAVGDVDGDRKADVLALGGPDPNHLFLAVLLAARSFAAERIPFDSLQPGRLQLADMNGDGRPDVLGLCPGAICTLLGRGDGSFAAPLPLYVATGSSFALGRLDDDAHVDVVVGDTRGRALLVVRGHGDGSFGSGTELPAGANPAHLLACDLTGDGRLDLVTADTGGSTISLLEGRAEGGFAPRRSFAVNAGVNFLAAGDTDGDGDLDLVLTAVRGRASEVALCRNQGGGVFDRPQSLATGADPATAVLADVNGDRKLDLLLPRATQPDVLLYLGAKEGFQSPRHLAVPHIAHHLVAGDLNGDGKQDLVIADHRQNIITVMVGAGDGTFTPAPAIRSKRELESLAIADVNRDGKLDLVLGPRRTTRTGAVLAGNGDGTFGQRTDFEVGFAAGTPMLADLDGDGWLDLACPDTEAGSVTLQRGGPQGLGERLDVGAGPDVSGLAIVDYDGDSRPDLAVTNRETSAVTLLRNLGP